jgi:hypothetical protein
MYVETFYDLNSIVNNEKYVGFTPKQKKKLIKKCLKEVIAKMPKPEPEPA